MVDGLISKAIVRLVLIGGALIFGIGQASASGAGDRGYPLDSISPANRGIVIEAMKIIERECPGVGRIDWRDLANRAERIKPFMISPPTIKINQVPKVVAPGSWSSSREWEAYGWPARLSVNIQLPTQTSAGTVISLSVGGGKRPGIESHASGGYSGKELCGLKPLPDGYAFRQVPDLSVLDRLR